MEVNNGRGKSYYTKKRAKYQNAKPNNSINMKSYSIKLPCYVVAFAFDVFHFP